MSVIQRITEQGFDLSTRDVARWSNQLQLTMLRSGKAKKCMGEVGKWGGISRMRYRRGEGERGLSFGTVIHWFRKACSLI
jgi:hypothetical protein